MKMSEKTEWGSRVNIKIITPDVICEGPTGESVVCE
jgi:hypothetical protein